MPELNGIYPIKNEATLKGYPKFRKFESVNKWHDIRAYLHYLRRAKTRYGIHSPFVYHLLTDVIGDKTTYPDYDRLRKYRRSLLTDKTYLNVTDLGAGSRHFRFGKRRIDKMARRSASSWKENKLWYRLARHFQPEKILELGTHLGTATYALATAAPQAEIISVEGSTELALKASEQLRKFGINRVKIIQGDFDRVLPELTEKHTFDLVLVDGNHRYAPTLRYFEWLLNAVHNDSLIIWDDIHWSPEMEKAWDVISAHPRIRVSIDLFCCGLTFFRREQQKEHFVLRF